jgi:hypothetical protein
MPPNKTLERTGGERSYFHPSGGGRRPLSAGSLRVGRPGAASVRAHTDAEGEERVY